MSKECSYMNFKKFLDEIEKRKMAVVVRDVWTDFMKDEDVETIRKQNPESQDLPIIWVPKNWAIGTYHPSGWVQDGSIYVEDEELEKQMYILAEEMDLSLYPAWSAEEVEDEDWTPEGIFKIASDLD
jgi:hypothetical protein